MTIVCWIINLFEIMKKPTIAQTLWILIIIIFVAKVFAIASIYSDLPPRIATHFDLHGVPNGYSERWGIWEVLAIDLGVTLIMWLTTLMPASMITGMSDVPEEERAAALGRQHTLMAFIALAMSLVMAWAAYYIVVHN